MMFKTIWLIPCIFLFSPYFTNCDKLLAVTSLVRHGERLGSYEGFDPNDPNIDIRMENPSDQLLNLGVEELYNVGLWLRHHYSDFLRLKYDPKEIYVQSIDFDRCLMSAGALLAGLYPPVGDEVWNRNIPWQPVPIHTTPNKVDILLQWSACPYYTIQSRKALELQKKISEENAELFKFLTEKTGSPMNLSSTLLLYNVLEGEKLINLTLPLWTHGVIRDIKPLVEVSFVVDTIDKRLKILRAGPLVHRLLEQFDRAISGKKFGTTDDIYRKMMLYSTADMTVYYLADSLNVDNFGIVNYGFSIYFELWEADNGTHYVDVFFRNSTDVYAPSHPGRVRGYGSTLSFSAFKEMAGRVSINITDWFSFCKNLLKSENSTRQ
ncbi:testicular acid phosphatase homolog [Coccinella septempunctata]|uniref:testicular acid phosphatase homolog n=1 Tax=Coccinella septempunctata TaxID=41139 RepID=UPI001D069285|nr:testicular acid phosphatase homolog [Coccinella septempunctata]